MSVKKLKESSSRSTFNRSGYSFEEVVNSYDGMWWVSVVPEDFYEDYEAYSEDGEDWLILKNGDEVGQERSDDRKEVADILIQYAGLEEGVKNKMSVKKLKESKYGVFRVGGSIGDNDPKGRVTKRIDGWLGILVKEFDDAESAKKYAAERRKSLSPGERKRYGLSYRVAKLDESLKEGYSDGTVSTSEIMDAINALEELVEMMDDAGVSSIHASSSTYGLGQHFIGFPGGFINYNDVYSYVSEDEDEDYDEDVDEGWH